MKINILFFIAIIFIGCSVNENLEEQEEQELQISSIEEKIKKGSGLYLKFSHKIDFKSLNYEKIVRRLSEYNTVYERFYIVDTTKFDNIVYIKNCKDILLNGNPSSFWYNEKENILAMINETNEKNPNGVMDFFEIKEQNIISIDKKVKFINAKFLTENRLVKFQGDTSKSTNIIFNPCVPVYAEWYLPKVTFNNIKEVAKISIYDITKKLIRTIEKTDNYSNFVCWDLRDFDYKHVERGIYFYDIENSENHIKNGIFILLHEKPIVTKF